MADITLNTRTTDIPRAQSGVYGAARVSGAVNAAPSAQGAAPSALGPATTVTATIAADVLLAAQQSREPDRPRGFDVRSAYDRTARRQQEELDPRDPQADRANPDDGGQAPSTASRATGAAATALGDNVVRLFATSGNTQSADAAAVSRDRADHARANQAYVGAGAADGLTFARAGVDTSLRPDRTGFDILI